MPQNVTHGKKGFVLINQYDARKVLRGARVPLTKDMPDASTFGLGDKEFAVGMKSASMSFEGLLKGDKAVIREKFENMLTPVIVVTQVATLTFDSVEPLQFHAIRRVGGTKVFRFQAGAITNAALKAGIESVATGAIVTVTGAALTGAPLLSGVKNISVSGGQNINLEIVSGPVRQVAIAGGDANPYTINGGAPLTLPFNAATLQNNQRLISVAHNGDVVSGTSDNESANFKIFSPVGKVLPNPTSTGTGITNTALVAGGTLSPDIEFDETTAGSVTVDEGGTLEEQENVLLYAKNGIHRGALAWIGRSLQNTLEVSTPTDGLAQLNSTFQVKGGCRLGVSLYDTFVNDTFVPNPVVATGNGVSVQIESKTDELGNAIEFSETGWTAQLHVLEISEGASLTVSFTDSADDITHDEVAEFDAFTEPGWARLISPSEDDVLRKYLRAHFEITNGGSAVVALVVSRYASQS